MADVDYDRLSNQELLQKLDDAAFIERFERGDDWKLFREACRRLADQAAFEMDRIDPIKDPTGIIERQVIRKFCQNTVLGIIRSFKEEGKVAFNEARARELKDVTPNDL